MDEHLKALQFYRIVKTALRTVGIKKLILTLDKDGEIEMNVEMENANE
jgi:hypothetical protein